jgi:hypothetical protein
LSPISGVVWSLYVVASVFSLFCKLRSSC